MIEVRFPIYSVGHGWRPSDWCLGELVQRRGFALFVLSPRDCLCHKMFIRGKARGKRVSVRRFSVHDITGFTH